MQLLPRWREVNPCDNCGAREWVRPSLWVQLRSWLNMGGPWGAGPRTCRRCGERVEIGGGYGTRALGPPRFAPLRVALTPAWFVLALRRSRTAHPVPRTYVYAGVVGVMLGVVAQLVFHIDWWLVAIGFVMAVWLVFLTTARHNLRNVGQTFIRLTAPGLAVRASERSFENAFRGPAFALYGLSSNWTGRRFLGGHGSDGRNVTSLTLGHGDPYDEGGPEIRIENSIHENDPIEWRCRQAFESLIRATRRPPRGIERDDFVAWVRRFHRELGELPDPEWERLQIRLDGRPIMFNVAREGGNWVAVARVDEEFVVIEGRGMSPEEVELVRIRDVDPYVEGSRSMREEKRAAHGH